MIAGFSLSVLSAVVLVVFAGGLVKGTAGFGYAITSTAILATFLSPSVAVVVMILPMLVANVTLVGELDRSELSRCLARFWPYLLAAVVGTLAGMAALNRVPTAVVALGLGLFTLFYVAVTQDTVRIPGERWLADRCFRSGTMARAGLGLLSGVVFGASNVAVQVVAYLDSLDLDRATFVGVLAMILVGVSSIRIGAAWWLGLYATGGVPARALLAVSAAASVPGVAGVAAGRRLRDYVPERHQTGGALALLAVIGVRLTYAGVTGL